MYLNYLNSAHMFIQLNTELKSLSKLLDSKEAKEKFGKSKCGLDLSFSYVLRLPCLIQRRSVELYQQLKHD